MPELENNKQVVQVAQIRRAKQGGSFQHGSGQTICNPKGSARSGPELVCRVMHGSIQSIRVWSLKRRRFRCNVVVFNSLIDACVRACDLQGAAEAQTGSNI